MITLLMTNNIGRDSDSGWGIVLPRSHPFYIANLAHNIAYKCRVGESSYPYDRLLLKNCLKISKARKSVSLKLQAYGLYFLARVIGIWGW